MEAIQATSEPLIERRRLPRLNLAAPIQFRNILKPQQSFSGSLSRDISAGGLQVATGGFLPKEARLVLLVSLPTLPKPLRAIVRVAWVAKKRFSDAYDCGFQFIEIAPEDRETIADYVERGVVTRS